jgi:cytochrome c oxidase cbb3-type subunit I
VFLGTILQAQGKAHLRRQLVPAVFIVTVAMLHIVNNLSIPVSIWGSKSVQVFSGVQDAMVQWWYGHNAVGFFLTAGFLGMMYYFVPKQAERPVYSYKLSIIHFWALIFLYIWAGPHHLHYTALPDWASTLGMVFSIVLWMPSWGGMINGLMTLSGAWDKLRTDPVIRMMVISIGFYGMSTFEGPMMSIRAVNSLSHYTDWTIGHVHSGALGWNGMITFGALYFLVPRLWNRERLYSLPGQLALLARDHRHRALRRLDVGDRHHGRPDVARSRCAGLPRELLRRHGRRQVPDVCGARAGRGPVPRRGDHHVLQPLDDRASRSPAKQ